MADNERGRIYTLPVDSPLIAREIVEGLVLPKIEEPLNRFLEHSSRISGVEGLELVALLSDSYRLGAVSLEMTPFIDANIADNSFREMLGVFNEFINQSEAQYPSIGFEPRLWISYSGRNMDVGLNARLNDPRGEHIISLIPKVEEGDKILSHHVARVVHPQVNRSVAYIREVPEHRHFRGRVAR